MTAVMIDRPALDWHVGEITTHTYARRRRFARRGTACLVAARPVADGAPTRWLQAAALAFDAVCVIGLAALVWSVVASLQPASVLAILG